MAPSQMRGGLGLWSGQHIYPIPVSVHTSLCEPHTYVHTLISSVWLLIFLILFVSRQKKRNNQIHLTPFGTLSSDAARYQRFMAPQPHGCAFGTQLNFIRTCPCQTKDKIMLLIQKLEGRFVRPPVSLNNFYVAKLSSVPARWPEPNAGVARHAGGSIFGS